MADMEKRIARFIEPPLAARDGPGRACPGSGSMASGRRSDAGSDGGRRGLSHRPLHEGGSVYWALVSAASIQASSASTPRAPTARSTRRPPRKNSNVGMPWTPKRAETPGCSSTLTLTSLSLPARRRATSSNAGEIIRHGPHHGAHKSTTTGIPEDSTTGPKSDSPASAIHGRSCLQHAHRGRPSAVAGTRLRFPQPGHSMITRPPHITDSLVAGRSRPNR